MGINVKRKAEKLKPEVYDGLIREIAKEHGQIVIETRAGMAVLNVNMQEVEEDSKDHYVIQTAEGRSVTIDEIASTFDFDQLKGKRVIVAAEPRRRSGGKFELEATGIFNVDQLKEAVAAYETAAPATANERQTTAISA